MRVQRLDLVVKRATLHEEHTTEEQPFVVLFYEQKDSMQKYS
jgi:hypothetical protein